MIFSYVFANNEYTIQTKSAKKFDYGLQLQGPQANVSLPIPIDSFYRHGWQSWSLAAWLPADFNLPVQKPEILHPLQIDPLYARHPTPNGSWIGAVRFTDGNVLLLGALGVDSHVALHKSELHGWYEADEGDWLITFGEEKEVFGRYARLLGERLGIAPGKTNPRVWCSWYSLYTAINEPNLYKTFDELDDLPFDVLQVDDGWQMKIGDWKANGKFPKGVSVVAEKIKSKGKQAGLWLAPLIAVQSSQLFKENPAWFLKDLNGRFVSAGFNWAEPLFALDTTHPDVLDWLASLMRQVRNWGFDYLKLDFLYAGALPGVRHANISRELAYRQGLKTVRDAMGEDAYFLACGAPIIPSIGLCDAIRVGPDVANFWESYRDAVYLYNPTTPGARNAIRTSVNRLWLSPLMAIDPDVVFFRSQHNSMNSDQNKILQDLALVCNFKATSDLPVWLNVDERRALRTFLEYTPTIKQKDRHSYFLDGRFVDFSPAIQLPKPPRGLNTILSVIIGWFGSQTWVLRTLDKLGGWTLDRILKGL